MNRDSNLNACRAACASVMVYGAVWLVCLAFYWGSLMTGALAGGAIMGYTLLVLYVILPIAGSVASFLVGRDHCLRGCRFLAPLASAALYFIFTGATFGLSTALGLTNIAPADARLVLFVFTCSFLGLAIGMGVDALARAKR